MARKSETSLFLNITLAILFIAVGLAGITHYNSNSAQFMRNINDVFGGSNDIIPIVMAIIELAAGVIIILSLFSIIRGDIVKISYLVIFIYWAVKVALNYFVEDFAEPDFLVWLGNVAPSLVILAAVWAAYREQ